MVKAVLGGEGCFFRGRQYTVCSEWGDGVNHENGMWYEVEIELTKVRELNVNYSMIFSDLTPSF